MNRYKVEPMGNRYPAIWDAQRRKVAAIYGELRHRINYSYEDAKAVCDWLNEREEMIRYQPRVDAEIARLREFKEP